MDEDRAIPDETAPQEKAPPDDEAAQDDELTPVEEPTPEDVDDFDAREAARIHRRDHDAEAHRRELMRPGMGKVFKQITDSWAKEAPPDHDRARKGAPRGDDRPR